MKKRRGILVVNRLADTEITHPQAVYDRSCLRCKGPVVLYPSSLDAMAKNPHVAWDVICTHCVIHEPPPKPGMVFRARGGAKEAAESFDFTKKKQ